MTKTSRPALPWIVRMSAPRRLAIVLVAAASGFFALEPWLSAHTRLLISWNVGALCYLGLAWMTIARADATMTRVRAQAHDQSGYVIFLLVATAAGASFVAIGFLVGDIKSLPFWARAGHLTLSITALLLSWLLIQTLFAFHYARGYYPRSPKSTAQGGGLRFPGD
ncbi:MAG: DUF1345 domain-containing protein, partial [Casimicrobiaceae bacterium]